jgi:hypothetical protein
MIRYTARDKGKEMIRYTAHEKGQEMIRIRQSSLTHINKSQGPDGSMI